MSDIAIKVDSLSKSYLVGHKVQSRQADNFREVLGRSLRSLRRSAADMLKGRQIVAGDEIEEFWALDDLNFEIKKGERVGIIGRNGAGKSTLLKILSRITEPSRGRVVLNGRVASLLEVGTGFHPELSGRENIYLNGSILGMSRREVSRKFEQIVDFSQVEKFLDTPVKRYSSGMYVRLAFAVAAHLEPEILIVDEVLAVGDAEFQRKCLAKMRREGEEGRTIIFVSHNLAAVRQLCTRGIVLDRGKLCHTGDQFSATDYYLRSSFAGTGPLSDKIEYSADETKAFQVLGVSIVGETGENSHVFNCDEPLTIVIDCLSRTPVPGLYGYLAIKNQEDVTIWESDSKDLPPSQLERLTPGIYKLAIKIGPRLLGHGEYTVYLSFASPQADGGFLVDSPGNTVKFQLSDTATVRGDRRNGHLSALLNWRVTSVSGGENGSAALTGPS